jgi:hypothetical protein
MEQRARLFPCFALSSTLIMEANHSSETLIDVIHDVTSQDMELFFRNNFDIILASMPKPLTLTPPFRFPN